ncbi:hypothetical protein CAPI_06630 [Corynebacterium capitovis DSM 44611]|uniref:hypothetical protein n=1 Tax=Corynebacterium capitovis TaxID=131081 RepID=UPI0003680320|nr:hypothetical protein [Corynebacterium capitovis]WKD57866.1 hypothetical protein CAPI_06630 [Corynebacterium capitovis DSM 44611]
MFTFSTRPRAAETPTPTDITEQHPATVDALHSVIRHPRSLARPTAQWRPPVKELPAIHGGPRLAVAVTRRRVGPRAKARIRGYGESAVPAYLVELRFTDATGLRTDRRHSDAWIRSLVADEDITAVHELGSPVAADYVWLVDGSYRPVPSPPSLFAGLAVA